MEEVPKNASQNVHTKIEDCLKNIKNLTTISGIELGVKLAEINSPFKNKMETWINIVKRLEELQVCACDRLIVNHLILALIL